MKKSISTLALLALGYCSYSQDIGRVTASEILDMARSEDTVYVVNFWATWCAPCVQELYEFDDLAEQYKGKPVSILMVSLDMRDTYPYKLQGFVKRKHMVPPVAWLDEADPNTFIPKIDENWEGSIPATLIVKPGTGRKFIEGQTNLQQLSGVVNKMLAGR